MPIKDSLREAVLSTVAGATILGGGSAVLGAWFTNGQQDVKIDQLKTEQAADREDIKAMRETLSRVATDTAVTRAQVEAMAAKVQP